MVNFAAIRDLEDEYDAKCRMFTELEHCLDDCFNQFHQRTNLLLEEVYAAYQEVDNPQDRDHYLYQLQDRFENYQRQYMSKRDMIDKLRQKERLAFNDKLDEEYQRKDEEEEEEVDSSYGWS